MDPQQIYDDEEDRDENRLRCCSQMHSLRTMKKKHITNATNLGGVLWGALQSHIQRTDTFASEKQQETTEMQVNIQ